MVRITVYRLYTAEEAVGLAAEPEVLARRIKTDRARPPMALVESRDAVHAAAVIDLISRAFGVAIMDIEHDVDALPEAHPLLDQGRALLKDAKRLDRRAKEES